MQTSELLLPANFGKLITITPPDPAVGTNFLFGVPVNTMILPISFSCILVADATAVTRTMLIATFDGSVNTFISASQMLHTAGLTRTYTCQADNNMLPTNSNYQYQVINLSALNYLRFGDEFRTVVDQLQAGDQITSCRLRYMQWIQE